MKFPLNQIVFDDHDAVYRLLSGSFGSLVRLGVPGKLPAVIRRDSDWMRFTLQHLIRKLLKLCCHAVNGYWGFIKTFALDCSSWSNEQIHF